MDTLKQITLGDGRMVEVAAKRYQAWDSFVRAKQNDIFAGDAGDGALSFFISQMTFLEETTFKRQYIPTQAEDLVPMDFRGGDHITSVTYRVSDATGIGRRKAAGSTQVHTADVAYTLKTFPVVPGEQGYQYNTEELRQSAYLRIPLNEDRMVESVEAYRRHINQVALYGEGELTGLFNNASVSHTAVSPFTGGWASATATPNTILSDVNLAINKVWTASGFNDWPTHCVAPPAAYQALVGTQLPHTNTSILKFLLENNLCAQNGRPFQIVAGYGLDNGATYNATGASQTAGSGGGYTRAVYYVKNPLRVVMEIPLPQRFLAPQLVNFDVKVPGEYKYSGVEVRYPSSMLYQDGV